MLTSLGVAFFRATLRDRAQTFVKKTIIYENDMTQFVFIFHARIKCEEWKKMWYEKIFILCDVSYSASKLTTVADII